jgi:16S rRNA (adenine1518-N6/adenine1519-N6)-dimethyltransferase
VIKPYPKKSLGQNYLTDPNICRKIVSSFNIKPHDIILEIGPGRGEITKYIADLTENVIAVELDKSNCEILEKILPHVRVINTDFLRFDIKEYAAIHKLRVIGNIPYNITSEIIFKLIDNRECITDAQLMVQSEVAGRLTADPGTKQYGITTVQLGAFAEVKSLFKVSRNCFYPPPTVDSRVIHIDFTKSKEHQIRDISIFRNIVKAAFSSRRKTLRNTLKNFIKDNIPDIDFARRAESLSVNEFIELSNKIS